MHTCSFLKLKIDSYADTKPSSVERAVVILASSRGAGVLAVLRAINSSGNCRWQVATTHVGIATSQLPTKSHTIHSKEAIKTNSPIPSEKVLVWAAGTLA